MSFEDAASQPVSILLPVNYTELDHASSSNVSSSQVSSSNVSSSPSKKQEQFRDKNDGQFTCLNMILFSCRFWLRFCLAIWQVCWRVGFLCFQEI